MGVEVLLSIVSGLLASLAGLASTTQLAQRFLRWLLGTCRPSRQSYSERLSKLTSGLTRASTEVDEILQELADVARSRETAVGKLESELSALETREKELTERIEVLQTVPIPVAEHFAHLVDAGERRGARRDYVLFGAGVIVTTVIAIIIQFVASL